MNVAAKLGAFVAALGVVFAAAYGSGAMVGPVANPTQSSHETDGANAPGHGQPSGDGGDHAAGAGPGGLAVSADGYTLLRLSPDLRPGVTGEFAFQIVDAHATPVTRFQISHDKPLHLVVVRRDLTGFQHLHPQMSSDGTWRTNMSLPEAGDWRVFADFRPETADQQVILGVDVPVAGTYQPQPLPDPQGASQVDGYTVTTHGDLLAGRTSRLSLTVARNETPVTDLQPYLGAFGHLVALRAGDLAYLHVHPQSTSSAGPAITFDIEVSTAGTYRLFLQFQHDGVVRTVAFTAVAT
jgi:hypothetical protein